MPCPIGPGLVALSLILLSLVLPFAIPLSLSGPASPRSQILEKLTTSLASSTFVSLKANLPPLPPAEGDAKFTPVLKGVRGRLVNVKGAQHLQLTRMYTTRETHTNLPCANVEGLRGIEEEVEGIMELGVKTLSVREASKNWVYR